MRSSMGHVQSGVNSARSAGEALTSIIHGSESVQKMVTQIASASTEQSYSTQSVVTNVNEIVSIIERTAASSQQSVRACEQLSSLADQLSKLVGSFKVGEDQDNAETETSARIASRAVAVRNPRGFSRPIAASHA